MRGDVLMTRLEAIADIKCGRGIMLTFQGRFTSYRVILRRDAADFEKVEAVIEDTKSWRHRIFFIRHLTAKQVMHYIKRWYPRTITDKIIDTQSPTLWKEVA